MSEARKRLWEWLCDHLDMDPRIAMDGVDALEAFVHGEPMVTAERLPAQTVGDIVRERDELREARDNLQVVADGWRKQYETRATEAARVVTVWRGYAERLEGHVKGLDGHTVTSMQTRAKFRDLLAEVERGPGGATDSPKPYDRARHEAWQGFCRDGARGGGQAGAFYAGYDAGREAKGELATVATPEWSPEDLWRRVEDAIGGVHACPSATEGFLAWSIEDATRDEQVKAPTIRAALLALLAKLEVPDG